jgi:GTP-binding protein HflX
VRLNGRNGNHVQRAFLVGAHVRGEATLFDTDASLDELADLARSAGLRVVGRDQQNLDRVNPATYVGSGKVAEIKEECLERDAELVILDDELSPAQLRTLERELGLTVLDRTALILDIFALRASTREGALQVELAQYAYRLPRLTRQWTHLSRQAVGGVGLRGPGETQLESDRREIGRRMAQLRREIDQVRNLRGQRRRQRRRQGLPTVAIVGYTNAGKSTLLNLLTSANVLAQDNLFATLDPTTRRLELPGGKQVLFTDTVGFIQKLPTQLVAAFRATLEEVNDADILLHVADASDPLLLLKVEAVEQVLQEIGAGDKPMILALNKIDLVDAGALEQEESNRFVRRPATVETLRDKYQRVVYLSATQNVGVEELLAQVEELLLAEMVVCEAVLPYSAGEVLSSWREHGLLESVDYAPDGIHVEGRLPRWATGILDDLQP